MKNYTVQKGDTLIGISKQFGVPVEEIEKINNIENDMITVGQVLKIPTTQTIIYTVKKNDNLYDIAREYNTTVEEIMTINNLPNHNLSIGQQLIIPLKEPTSTNTYFNYTVQAGDSLYTIANKFNTTVEQIEKENNLSSTLLTVGQQLKIPTQNNLIPQTQTYVVKQGDSIYSIAQKYGMTVEELMKLNSLTSPALSIGQTLKVQNQTEATETIKECFGTSYTEPTYETYTVKRGDSLYTIANKFNTTIENLRKMNNLTTDNLEIGQILKIREMNE